MADTKNESTALALDTINNLEYTGIETQQTVKIKPIKILQSDKQYKYFSDKEDISLKDYGKLFLVDQDSLISKNQLKDSIEGTLIKNSFGHIIYPTNEYGKIAKDAKPVGSATGQVRKADRESWRKRNPGFDYKNIIKILICLVKPNEIAESVAKGVSPLAMLTLRGTAYSSWFGIEEKMNIALESQPEIKTNKRIAPMFKLKIKSKIIQLKLENSSSDTGVYVPDIAVEANDIKTVVEFVDFWKLSKDLNLYGAWKANKSEELDRLSKETNTGEILVSDLPF